MSLNTLNTLRAEINRLGFTPEEQNSLHKYFIQNVEKLDVIVTFLPDYPTDDDKRGYFKSLISTPTSMENISNLFGQMNLSGSSSSEEVSSFTFFTELVKVMREDSEKTREVIKANMEVMARLERNTPEQSHETGSITRARAYQSIDFEGVDLGHFLGESRPSFDRLGKIDIYRNIETYLNDKRAPTASEEAVQEWFDDLMKVLPKFSSQAVVKDTHTNAYLEGYKPDFSILLYEDAVNDVYIPMFVCTLLEVKKRKGPHSALASEDKGQLLDYINVLIQQQPLRVHFAIFLSDGFNFYVMGYNRNTKQYSEYTTNIAAGIRLFWALINDGSPFTSLAGPRSVDFETDLLTEKISLKRCLGEGASSTVYEIDWKNISSAIKVFNSDNNPNYEAKALIFLNKENIQNTPIYVTHDKRSIIIRPVCKRIGDQFLVSHALQLLHLLKRIHSMKIYHRDVRPENILLDKNTLILVDWGSSIQYPIGVNTRIQYEGTITFASPDILNNDFGRYKPKASDDLHSF
ncbi:kinase-like domain-containing protein, partial [Rhizophagus diaphanus]